MPSKPTNNTDLFFGVPERVAELVVRYYDANLSESESAELRAGLEQSASARDLFVRWGLQIQTLTESLAPEYSESDESIPLEQLAEMENEAQADLVTLVDDLPAAHAKPSAHEFAEAARYLFEHATANKRALYTAGSAIAAVLLLALTLIFVFSGGDDEPIADPLADTPLWDMPTPTPTTHRPVVATLTDAVGAQWRSDDKPVPMPMGAQLVAYERLTLTQGFAEITTRRGATALLQAPATIELTDSDNAIRLHSGKLVGKCLVPSSKGFTVHAPGMDVVDLGTEFGVKADTTQGSSVLVMTGAVRAEPTEQSPLAFTPVVLRENQARKVVPETGGLGMIAANEAPLFHTQPVNPYVAMVMEAKPAWWLRQDGNDSSELLDSARYGQTSAGFGVLELDGKGGADLGDVLDFSADQPFSVGVWIKPDLRQEDMFVLGRIAFNDSVGYHGYDLYIKARRLRVQLIAQFMAGAQQDAMVRVATADELAHDQWQYVVATYDGSGRASGVQIYLDGAASTGPVIDDSLEGKSFRADTTFRMGLRGFAEPDAVIQDETDEKKLQIKKGSPMTGQLGDLAVFDRVLSVEEIQMLYTHSRQAYPDLSEGS